MPKAVAHWLAFEQSVNDRTFRTSVHGPIDLVAPAIRPACRPEAAAWWPLEVSFLPASLTRAYGALESSLEEVLGLEIPGGRRPLFLHPQPPAAQRRLRRSHGSVVLGGVRVTPTASYRSLLAWDGSHTPIILKLSLGAVAGRLRRALGERDIASAVMMSRLLATIPDRTRGQLGLDWFPEVAGLVETEGKSGWLLRRLPRATGCRPGHSLVPAFSLTARPGKRPPLLAEIVRAAGGDRVGFIIERLIVPYVRALAHLLFEEGIQTEGHPQNVLFELDAKSGLTGRLALRDLSDLSLSIAFRIAKQKPFPRPAADYCPANVPFPIASVAGDHLCKPMRSKITRGRDTVERYGLESFVRAITHSLAPDMTDREAERIEQTYLELWQREAVRSLSLEPELCRRRKRLATDEAMAHFLQTADWRSLGATGKSTLPENAEPLFIGRRFRKQSRAVYERLECAWGTLFLAKGWPAFFSPAF